MSSTKNGAVSGPISIDPEFWQSLQVYPDAIGHDETRDAYQKRAQELLGGLPLSNLKYICDALGVAYTDNEDVPQPLAHRLMGSPHGPLLACLSEFQKRHINHIVDFFDKRFPAKAAQRIVADIASKSRGGRDVPRPLVKLMVIFLNRKEDLALIHYTYNWRRLQTIKEFDIKGGAPNSAKTKLEGSIEELLKRLGRIKDGEEYTFYGTGEVRTGLDVFVLHRNYRTAVKPDYRDRYRFQHDYGQVVFGLNSRRSALVVKVANRLIRDVIVDWVRRTLDVELTASGSALFADYSAEQIAIELMGGYDESHGLDLLGVEFRHSALPAGSPLAITASEFSRSIKDELTWLRGKSVLHVNALSDLSALTLRFKQMPAKVEVRTEKGGAITLNLIDQHLDEDYVDEFKEAFLKTFHLPIGRKIDPTAMRMGAADIYQHLLAGVDGDQVSPYQRDKLERVLDLELLKPVKSRIGKCHHLNCTSGSTRFTDDDAVNDCPSCQTPLKWDDHTRYKLNPAAIPKAMKAILEKATGRVLSTTPHKFEGHSVHRLTDEEKPGKFIHVFFNERLGSEKMDSFRRSMFPMLIVHPTGSPKGPVIDGDGIAHMGVGYALAASEDHDAEESFESQTRAVVRRLMQMEQERILRAARHSRDSLSTKGADYHDRKFESDVYNLMRCLFRYSIKLGGKNKPDGFSSFVYFEEGQLSDPTKVNLSYDAKFSDKTDGYDFGIEENRQIHEYIRSFRRSKHLQRESNGYDGHIIIYNHIKRSSLANAANYLWNVDRLPKLKENFLLVFMHESFLIKMWDLLHDKSAEIVKRWYSFPEAFHLALKMNQRDGCTLLDGRNAEDIIEGILDEPPIDNPIDHDSLLADLERFVNQRTNRPAPQGAASLN